MSAGFENSIVKLLAEALFVVLQEFLFKAASFENAESAESLSRLVVTSM